MAKPAATISHFHVCPKVTAKVPHVGGPVVQGSSNVFIGGLPAARVGDTLICIGPPDKIKKGSATVFVNGKPAARMGDPTDHGGVIVVGNPTVLIGDQSYTVTGGAVGSGPQLKGPRNDSSCAAGDSSPAVALAAQRQALQERTPLCAVCEEGKQREANDADLT